MQVQVGQHNVLPVTIESSSHFPPVYTNGMQPLLHFIAHTHHKSWTLEHRFFFF